MASSPPGFFDPGLSAADTNAAHALEESSNGWLRWNARGLRWLLQFLGLAQAGLLAGVLVFLEELSQSASGENGAWAWIQLLGLAALPVAYVVTLWRLHAAGRRSPELRGTEPQPKSAALLKGSVVDVPANPSLL